MKISIVGGGGRVGLPLGIKLAEVGHKIAIIDFDEKRNELINQRIMPFNERDLDLVLRNLTPEALFASSKNSYIENSDICIIIIGTPILENGLPSTNLLLNLVNNLIPCLKNTKLLMLRSTVYPGVTSEIINLIKQTDLNLEVSFCPERIAEGKAVEELQVLPQIIGADTDEAYVLSSRVFDGISREIIRVTIQEAELTKLFANAYRYINFAIANQFFEICLKNNIEWENVWHALKFKYPRAASFPTPGFTAGPCLVKDTQQLNYYFSNNFTLGKAALKINEYFPELIVERLDKLLKLQDKKVGILGMTFKGDVDDFRSSLSFRLKDVLENFAEIVYCSDALLKKDYFIEKSELIELSDIIIVAAPHHSYKDVITKKPVVDIWRITQNESLI